MLSFLIFAYWFIGVLHAAWSVFETEPGHRLTLPDLGYKIVAWPYILWKKYGAKK